MQQEIKDLGLALAKQAEDAVGEAAKSWTPEQRQTVVGAGVAVAQFGLYLKAKPDEAAPFKPIAESVIERLKSIGSKESGDTLHRFFSGALKVLEVAVPIVVKLVL